MPDRSVDAVGDARTSRRDAHRRLAAFVGFLLVCVAIAVLITHRVETEWEDDQRAAAAQRDAAAVGLAVARLIDATRGLAGLHAASDRVTRDEFATFTRPAIDAGAAVALNRLDVVADDRRPAFERRLGREIWVRDGSDRRVTAPPAPRYAVVVSVTSRTPYSSAVGYDALSDPQRAEALRRSAATGEPAATRVVTLADSGRPGIIVYAPRYRAGAPAETRAQRELALVGWVGGWIDNRQLALAVAPIAEEREGGVRVSQQGRTLVETEPFEGARTRATVDVAGSMLEVEANGGGGIPIAAWVALVGLVAALLAGLLFRQRLIGERQSDELAVLRARERDEALRIGEAERVAAQTLFGQLEDHAVYRFDADLRVTAAGGGLVQASGFTSADIIGRKLHEMPDAAELEPMMRSAIAGAAESTEAEAAGMHLWVQTAPLTPGEEGLLVITNVTGLERERAGRAEAEVRFRRAFEDAPVGVAIADLDGRYVEVNRALCDMLGYDAEELKGKSFTLTTRAEDVPVLADVLRAHPEREVRGFTAEVRAVQASGETVWTEVHATTLVGRDGKPEGTLCQIMDVTDRRRFEARLQHMADHDPLTGLENRRAFERQLEMQLANVRRYGAEGALLVVDLDHFQVLNDTLGHSAGDAVVANAARILRELLRDSDGLARLGGDEFAILLPRADRDEAGEVASRVVRAIREQGAVLDGQRPGSVTASVGVTLLDPVQATGEQALVDAEVAMYDAKDAGRDGFSVFEPGMESVKSRTKIRLTWIERIRTALDEDRFTLVAQPIHSLTEERVVHHELLLRMVGDDGELIPPASFLPIAERFGLIGEIDAWVVRQAIRALADRSAEDLVFEVNLSGPSIGSPEILTVIERELQQTGVDPKRVIFEITETAAVANVTEAREFAERLGELGCRFALDDFGAGFGSFYYLKHLPCDFLKIDGEFVRNLASTPTDQVIVSGLVQIAHGLGKRTIAEFVEDGETMELLRREGVDMAQGYHVGRPGPLDAVLSARAASKP
jgi:diguanylate cyclase (GGDEF)-like protein/PAS domain S-box-containing protein